MIVADEGGPREADGSIYICCVEMIFVKKRLEAPTVRS